MSDPILTCPECGGDDLIVRAVTSYKVNSGEFFCHSVKSHDSNAEVTCLTCDWIGQRCNLWEGK